MLTKFQQYVKGIYQDAPDAYINRADLCFLENDFPEEYEGVSELAIQNVDLKEMFDNAIRGWYQVNQDLFIVSAKQEFKKLIKSTLLDIEEIEESQQEEQCYMELPKRHEEMNRE